MAYAISTDITARYSNAELLIVADRDADGVADTGVITQALGDAANEIDAYLANRYTLPLAVVPGVLVRVCVDIAMYRMAENAAALTDEKRKRFEDAIRFLQDVAKGVASLGETGPTTTLTSTVKYATDTRRWTRGLTLDVF